MELIGSRPVQNSSTCQSGTQYRVLSIWGRGSGLVSQVPCLAALSERTVVSAEPQNQEQKNSIFLLQSSLPRNQFTVCHKVSSSLGISSFSFYSRIIKSEMAPRWYFGSRLLPNRCGKFQNIKWNEIVVWGTISTKKVFGCVLNAKIKVFCSAVAKCCRGFDVHK